MTARQSNLNVNVVNASSVTKAPSVGLDVMMSEGTSEQTARLSAFVLDPLSGRTIPKLGFCPGSRADALRFYNDDLGAAVTAAQNAFNNAIQPIQDSVDALNTVKQSLDRMLATNPDATTPHSVDELTDAIGGLRPTVDRNQLEQRLGELLDLNMVNGVLYPKGPANLGPLRQLAQSLALSADNCDVSQLGAAAGNGTIDATAAAAAAGRADGGETVVGAGDGFLLVTTGSQTVERVVGSTCGDDIVEFDVQTVPLGVNVNIDDAAEAAGEDPDGVGVQMFWLDSIKTDPATLQRLKALGLTAEELGAAVTGGSAGRLNSAVVDTSVVPALQAKLTDEELCELLSRPDTSSGINTTPTLEDVIATIRNAINQNTGSNQNRAGTDADAIETGAAGRGGDPVLLLFGLINFFRSAQAVPQCADELVEAVLAVANTTDAIALHEQLGLGDVVRLTVINKLIDARTEEEASAVLRELNVCDYAPLFDQLLGGQLALSDVSDVSDDCKFIVDLIVGSFAALQALLDQAQAFMRDLSQKLGLGNHQINAALGFAGCLVSFSLSLQVNVDLAVSIPFQMDLFLASFATMLTAVVAAVTAFRVVICKPQGIIALLYGGVCGFKPYDFTGCPPDIAALVDQFLQILTTILGLTGKLTGSLLTMKADVTATKALSATFKSFSPCAAAAAAIGLALGLGELSQLLPEATPTLAVTTTT